MSVEAWKSVFDIGTVVALFLAFAFGVGVWFTSNIINERQAEQIKQFDRGLTDAKTELGKQQERAANADARVAGLAQDAVNAKTEMAKQQERAAKAEQNLLELRGRLAPRILGPQQLVELTLVASKFSGQIVEVTRYTLSKESQSLSEQLESALTAAGWKVSITGYMGGAEQTAGISFMVGSGQTNMAAD